MKRSLTFFAIALLLLTSLAQAMGGFGGGGAPEKSDADTTKKLKLMPLDESSNAYGWVRITSDTLALGANRLPPDTVYSVYFVNGEKKQLLLMEEEQSIRTSGAGEAKFTTKLTEPLGAQWTKVVLFYHNDGNPESQSDIKPIMEASLR